MPDSSKLVRTYVNAVFAAGAFTLVATALVDPTLPRIVETNLGGVVAFIVLGLVLELADHRLAVGAAGGSIAFIVYLGAALVFGPALTAAIAVVSIGSAQLIVRRTPVKIVFNVGQWVISLVAGTVVYMTLGGTIPPQSLDSSLVPYAGLVLTYFTINSAAVSGVISLSEGRRFGDVWIRNSWGLAGYDLVASLLGLGIAWLYGTRGVLGLALIVVPILFLRHTYLVLLQLQATNRELLELMVKSIEARDPYTSGHSQRVSELARELARGLGLGYREVENIAAAALLHDVGKIYEEFAPILRKEGKLTAGEREIMESHPVRSAELVGTISSLRGDVEKIVRHHHENMDGSGYPDGLMGEEIPLGARVVMVADTTDAMTTNRPYRDALSYDTVLSELEKYKGRQFDPRVVDVFRRSVKVRRLVGARRPESEENLQNQEKHVQLVVQ